MSLKDWFIGHVYADHGESKQVRAALQECMNSLNGGPGLNVGCGSGTRHPSVINLDLHAGALVDCVGDAHALPFADNSFSLVITQETLEHLSNPDKAMGEIHRIYETWRASLLPAAVHNW